MRRFLSVALLSACAFAVSACGSGSDSRPVLPAETVARLDAAVAERMAADGLPGALVWVSIPGEGDYVVARGVANRATGAARRVDEPFRIASITKTFIGTAVLQLADQGRLSVTDRLSKWYPDFPQADLVTIDDLLRMRSGIADSADAAFLAEYYADPLLPLTPDDMIRRAAVRQSQFTAPGRTSVYTNVNFMLLERIVAKVAGREIDAQLRAAVFEPLGMTSTYYATDSTLPGGLRGYSVDAASGAFADRTVLNPTPAGGAGAMVSTAADLAIYARALCTGRLLAPQTQQARLRTDPLAGAPDFIRYGQGIIRFGRFCGHNGTIFGFSSELWYLPEKDAVIVIDVNRLDLDDASKSVNLFAQVTKILFPDLVSW